MTGDQDAAAPPDSHAGPDHATTGRSVGLDRQRVVLWGVAALFAIGLLLFVWRFVGVLIVGLFVYYVTRPLFDRIQERIGGRTRAVVVAILTVAVPTLLLVGWTAAVVVQAVGDFLGSAGAEQLLGVVDPYVDVSAELSTADQRLREALADPERAVRELGPLLSTTADALLGAVATLGTVALNAFVVLVVTFYLLRDDDRLAAWARRTFAFEDSVVETYLVRVDRELETIFFGNILNALATGLIAVVAYALLNTVAPPVVAIPQPTLVGLLVGVASLVPVIGIKVVTWPLGLYLAARSALVAPETIWFPAVFFVVSFVVVDAIPDQLLRPYVSGRSLHVGAVMLAYLFGPFLFGWYGIFLGPFLLVVVWEFGLIVLPWLTGVESAYPDADADGPDVTTVAESRPGAEANGAEAGDDDTAHSNADGRPDDEDEQP